MNEINRQVKLAIDAQRAALAQAIVARQYELQAKFWKPYGDPGRDKSVRDAAYHLSYLAEAIGAADPSLFADYVGWVKVLFAGLSFPAEVLETTLRCTGEALRAALPETGAAVAAEYVQAGLDHLRLAPATLASFLQDDAPLAGLARSYLEALVRGERRTASQLILDAVKQGVSIREIYLHVFQPVQQEIGRLWQMNQLSVAQEHYSTAVTQLVMSQLYPYIFAADKGSRRLVATCVGGELHEIGMRMVADLMEMDGWHTYYLGASMPTAGILRALADHSADVLAISATITYHVSQVAELIASVRASDAGHGVKIMVGGYPFNVSPNLWQAVGADGTAGSAEAAVLTANRLVTPGGL